jgi:hypothetical protein
VSSATELDGLDDEQDGAVADLDVMASMKITG